MNSSTAPKEGEEGEQQSTDRKDSIEERRGRVTHTTRAPRTGGGEGDRSRSWRKTKDWERPPGNKGSRGPHNGTAGGPPHDRREDTTGEGRSGAQIRPPERIQSQRGTKTRENSLRHEGRASRRPKGEEAEKTTPERGAAEPSGKSKEELQKGSRKEHQKEPSEERQEGSLKGKDTKRRGAETLERSPG